MRIPHGNYAMNSHGNSHMRISIAIPIGAMEIPIEITMGISIGMPMEIASSHRNSQEIPTNS